MSNQPQPVDLTGKTILVTGATSGIGQQAALELAGMGATVALHARDQRKAEEAVAAIRQATGNHNVDYLLADLFVMDGVRQLAAEFRARYSRLDVLVNNAGALFLRRRETADGFERTFALNHLAYFLLTELLLDMLLASAPARIVNTSSDAHYSGQIHFDGIHLRRGYSGMKAYSQSKLANVLHAYELARRLEGRGVTANALHPGFVATNFARNNLIARPFMPLVMLRGISIPEGTRTTMHVATAPELQDVSGQFFVKSKPARSSASSYDESAARRLWDLSAEMVGLA